MKIILFVLLVINTDLVLAQNGISDTTLRITDRVYIEAPKNTKVTSYYAESRLHFSIIPSSDVVFTYNNLHWETDSLMIDVRASYSGSAKNVSNYVETIEGDTSLTTEERCSLVAKKINYSFGNTQRMRSRDHSITKPIKIAGLYYHSDGMGMTLKIDRIAKKVLFIHYYKKIYIVEVYLERHILIDGVIYYFGVFLEYRAKANYKRRRKQAIKKVKSMKPAFYQLLDKVIIKDEEAEILIKEEE
jgi:hypothetical protein